MLRVAFVLRSTEVQPEFFWFVHTHKTQNNNTKQQQHNNNFHSNRALKNTGLVPQMAMPILPLKSFKFDLNPSNLPYLNFVRNPPAFFIESKNSISHFALCLLGAWGSPPLPRERERENNYRIFEYAGVFYCYVWDVLGGPPNMAIKTTGLVPQKAIPTPCPPYPHKLPF